MNRQTNRQNNLANIDSPSSAPDAHIVTENSPSSVLIDTCFCCQVPQVVVVVLLLPPNDPIPTWWLAPRIIRCSTKSSKISCFTRLL